MNLRLLAIGKITNSKYISIFDHYLKNIIVINKRVGITNFEIVEINKSNDKNTNSRKEKEYEVLVKKINLPDSINILLDESVSMTFAPHFIQSMM